MNENVNNDIDNDIKNEIDFIENKFLEFETKINNIEKKMDKIIEILQKDCKKMSDHIDFVENVYDNVKMPFYYIMNKVNHIVFDNMIDYEYKNIE